MKSPDYPDCKEALLKAVSTDLYCGNCRIRIAPAQGDALLVFNGKKQEYEAYCAHHCKAIGEIGMSTGDLRYVSSQIFGRLITVEEFWNYAYASYYYYPKKNAKILKKINVLSRRFKIVLDHGACTTWTESLESARNHIISPKRLGVPSFPSFPGVRVNKLFAN